MSKGKHPPTICRLCLWCVRQVDEAYLYDVYIDTLPDASRSARIRCHRCNTPYLLLYPIPYTVLISLALKRYAKVA